MSSKANARRLAISALKANPLAIFTGEQQARLDDPAFDVRFTDLGMDSLARMELSIWLELEQGIAITESELRLLDSLSGLEEFLALRLPE